MSTYLCTKKVRMLEPESRENRMIESRKRRMKEKGWERIIVSKERQLLFFFYPDTFQIREKNLLQRERKRKWRKREEWSLCLVVWRCIVSPLSLSPSLVSFSIFSVANNFLLTTVRNRGEWKNGKKERIGANTFIFFLSPSSIFLFPFFSLLFFIFLSSSVAFD